MGLILRVRKCVFSCHTERKIMCVYKTFITLIANVLIKKELEREKEINRERWRERDGEREGMGERNMKGKREKKIERGT